MLVSLITGLLALTTISVSSPVPAVKRDTAELYILANCYNNLTHASYASAFWYYPDFLPDYPEPQAVAVINSKKSVTFEGLKISVTSPFRLTAAIPKNATLATYQEIVASATISSFAGPAAAIKGTGEAFYSPATNVNCYYDYAVRDVSFLTTLLSERFKC
ncbi:hypothetical protein BCIN_11g06400 [Botrytis cinerea B05.10]|uniref:Uncharacterized protein n=1 Tax=Botryotinia fuckeliana (strain B05.10) TaxID=332648 RepID=A0A384JYE0_BOTFB|nr:hypothetical protein BCIN_11g06400 [Botrytis cinerea B05.10]ATZ55384.1 hypothetical protein BCIN_11g06400 [Botrytis cinerea B05.10]